MALLKFKRSAVSGKAPALADLELGELAINTFDGKVYMRKDNGTASIIEVGAASASGVLSFNTRTGAVTLSSGDVTTALGYTPANKAGDAFTGDISVPITKSFNCYTVNYGMGTPDSNGLQIYAAAGDTMRFGHRTGGVFTERFIMGSGGNVTANVDFRAPIFYDSNNTGYFVDPAGSSNLLSVQINGTLDVRDNNAQFWRSTNGAYQRVDTRTEATSLSRAHWYGVNSSGGTSNFRHAWYDNAAYFNITAQDGEIIFERTAGEAIVRSAGSFRAPIFYDSNDTAYYVNPNAATSLRTVGDWRSNSGDWTGEFSGKIQYHANHWYLQAAGDWYFRRSDAAHAFTVTQAGIAIALGDMRAPIFYDNNNTGFYLDPASRSNLSNITVASGGTESGIRFRGDTLDFVGRYSNYVSLYNANGPEFKLFDSSYAYLNVYGENVASWRAPIFYDSNDTGRYVDPNSTSSLYRLSSYIAAQDANANWNTGFQNTPAYSYNYHGDLNGGTNAPAAGWWFYESMRHSNASNYWGTQIAWGWEDNANRLWQRNVSGGGFGGWVEYLNTSNRTYNGNLNMTGSIISTSSDVRAPVFYDQNNTAYYIDAASGSNLAGDVVVGAAVYCYNWFRSYGATGWYNQTYGGGVWMNDTTWVRIYNSKAFLVDNQIAATGNITAYYSDERLKTKTGGIDNALAKVLDLDGFTYVENDLARSLGYTNKNQQVGVSAQAVKAVLPEAVALAPVDYETLEDGTIISKSGENYLTVDYSRIVPLLIEAIKELTNKVETLEAHIRSK